MSSTRRKLTPYQEELMELVRAGNPEGPGEIDFDQLLERLSWKPSKPACHFSIRALSNRSLLEKLPELQLRRGRLRVCFKLTPLGLTYLDPRPGLVDNPSESALQTLENQSEPGDLVTDLVPGLEDELSRWF